MHSASLLETNRNVQPAKRVRLFSRFVRWLRRSPDRRRANRESGLDLTAYYFDGGSPVAYRVRDLSVHGAYIETAWPWAAGTLMRFTLNFGTPAQEGEDASPCVPKAIVLFAEVVRTAKEGMGVRFLFADLNERRKYLEFHSAVTRSTERRGSDRRGASLVEFLLLMPLLFLLVVNVANFGGFMYAWITVSNSARTAAHYWATGAATVYGPSTPTASAVAALMTADVNTLPNKASLAVFVCTNNNGVQKLCSCATGTCPSTPIAPGDPEATSYVTGSVDVWYTYIPLVRFWDFPGLNIHAALVPRQTTANGNAVIHRQAVMRVMN